MSAKINVLSLTKEDSPIYGQKTNLEFEMDSKKYNVTMLDNACEIFENNQKIFERRPDDKGFTITNNISLTDEFTKSLESGLRNFDEKELVVNGFNFGDVIRSFDQLQSKTKKLNEMDVHTAKEKVELSTNTKYTQISFTLDNKIYSLIQKNQAEVGTSTMIYNEKGGAIYYSDAEGNFESILNKNEVRSIEKFLENKNLDPRISTKFVDVLENEKLKLEVVSHTSKENSEMVFFKNKNTMLGVYDKRDHEGNFMGTQVVRTDFKGQNPEPVFESDDKGRVLFSKFTDDEKKSIFRSRDAALTQTKEALARIEPISILDKKSGKEIYSGTGQEVAEYILKPGNSIYYKSQIIRDDSDKNGITMIKDGFIQLGKEINANIYKHTGVNPKEVGKDLAIVGKNVGKFAAAGITALYNKMKETTRNLEAYNKRAKEQEMMATNKKHSDSKSIVVR